MLKNIITSTLTICIFCVTLTNLSMAGEFLKNEGPTVAPIAPQWSEFCKEPYCQSSEIPIPELKPQPSAGFTILCCFVPFLLPLAYQKQAQANSSEKAWRKATEQNYWAERHKLFETEIAQCHQMQASDKIVECYMNLRQIESTKNQARQQEALMKQQINAIYSLYPRYYRY